MPKAKFTRVLLSALTIATFAVTPSVMAQTSPAMIWKQIHALEKSGFEQMSGKDYRAAANTFLSVIELTHQLPDNDARLKPAREQIEANLNAIDNRLEAKGDMALKEKVLRARLELLERTSGKNTMAYQVGLKKLMFALSEQGKTGELDGLDKQLNRDQRGPDPAIKLKPVGKRSPQPRRG